MNKNYSVVVAHPDDEVLWASSIIQDARKVIICFTKSPSSQQVTDGRNCFKDNSPDNFVFLDLTESKWIKRYTTLLSGIIHLNPRDLARNELLIYQHLQQEIDDEIIFTHNPWGEYGHPEHVQVHRVVSSFCKSRQKQFYTTGYYSRNTFRSRKSFIAKNKVIEVLHLPANKEIYCDLRDLYISSQCWTWDPQYTPPQSEFFYRFELGSKSAKNTVLSGSYILTASKYLKYLLVTSQPACTISNGMLVLLLYLIETLVYFPCRVAILLKILLKKAL